MKKFLLTLAATAMMVPALQAEEITFSNGKTYQIDRLIEREIGPGTTYLRMRLPQYPLNVNVVMVDLNNPYNRIETTTAKESSRGTESLVTAGRRLSTTGHRALAAANANFWIVGTQPEDQVFTGITRNVSLRNGKMVTESNQHRDQWDGGTNRTGIVSVSYDRTLYIDRCTSSIQAWGDKLPAHEVWQCNKGCWEDEMVMYNSFYGASTQFIPLYQDANGKYQRATGLTDVTEVVLDFAPGQSWVSGETMEFVVAEVRTATNGQGTLGKHDLALVGRGENATALAALAAGDKINLKYTWTFNPGKAAEVTPAIENAIGGNALVMRKGELLAANTNETYNSQVYSRTGYGCSEDGKTLYIVVIDKSTDPVYGTSAGCSTTIMCEIAKHLGCYNMANFDAGGSAEMMVNDAIINKTTEGTPRAVANGWMVFNIAPEDDNEVARLEFFDYALQQPIYAPGSPAVIAYNKYGSVLDYDYKDVTFSCDPAIGSCNGNVFTAGSQAATGLLTATVGNVSVSKEMTVIGADIAMRSDNIIIDSYREYPIEVVAVTKDRDYTYDPANIDWTVADETVATIDADGVLRGIANGTTTITGKIGNATTSATVTVEVATMPMQSLCAIGDWTIKVGTGLKLGDITDDGVINFNWGTKTAGYVDLSNKELMSYSLPDAIYVDFNATSPVSKVTMDILPATASRPITVNVEQEFAANTDHHIKIDMGDVDLNDICSFPLNIRRVRLTFKTVTTNKGDGKVAFGGVMMEYKHYDGIEDVVAPSGAAARLGLSHNPAVSGESVTVKGAGLTGVAVYSISGALVATYSAEGDLAVITAPAPGTYVVAAMTADGPASAIMLVR